MLTKRIIACLDVKAGRVVKGVQFEALRDAGDPAELALAHAEAGADEIVFLDITATHENRTTLLAIVRKAARQLFIPFTVGGGIRTLSEAAAVFDAGADKISLNSAALHDPSLITRIAQRFGSQAAVVAIDAKHTANGSYEVFVSGGRTATGRDALEWAKEAEARGAGEILVTSMDRDGTAAGFECQLTSRLASALQIPVIASGGAGNAAHFVEVFQQGHADAALAASILHFGQVSIASLKQTLQAEGIPMRWPC
jgi:imidazole glycerol-phosphate synthase subunit HisF